jgi:hypothetical protein
MLREFQELKENVSRAINSADSISELIDVVFNEYNEVAKSRDAYAIENERLKDYEIEWKLLAGENAKYKRMLTEKSQEIEGLVSSLLRVDQMNFFARIRFVITGKRGSHE